jgi:hypothetical protein
MQEPLQAAEPTWEPQQTGTNAAGQPSSFSLGATNTPLQKQPVWGTSGVEYSPTPQGYPVLKNHPASQYLLAPGNIDLSQRQMIDNPEDPKHPDPREYGSEYSARRRLPNGNWMSFPTIYEGKTHNVDEAYENALKTGQHMGIYHGSIPDHVINDAETKLHARPIYVNGKLLNGDMWAAMKAKKKISNVVKK